MVREKETPSGQRANDRPINHQDHEKGFVFFLQCDDCSLPKLWIFDTPLLIIV